MTEEYTLGYGPPMNLTPEEQVLWDEMAANNTQALEAMLRGETVEFEDVSKITKDQDPVMRDLVTKLLSTWDRRGLE